MKQFNVAILGAGMVADYHRQGILACADLGVRLAAIGCHNPAKANGIASKFGAPAYDYAQILADPTIAAVAICTPSGQHAEQAIAALHAGKHVLVEKPMALALADADAMIEAAARHNLTLAVALQRRTDPVFQRVHEAIAAGDLGQMTLATVTLPYQRTAAYYAQADWRGTWTLDGGGVLMNQGIHLVDQLVWNMGDPVKVTAHAATLQHNIEVEDTLVATLRFANGALATITATTTAAPGFAHTLGFYGTKGGIQIEGETVQRWALVDAARATVPPIVTTSGDSTIGAGGDPRGIAATGHIAIWQDFVMAIQEGHAALVDGREARRSLAAVLAIYRAAGLI